MQYRENTDIFYAGFGVRLAAYIVDSFLIGLALLIVRLPYLISSIANPDNVLSAPLLFKFSPFDILIYLLTALYFVLTLYFSGASLGKKFFDLKVVKADGGKITFINALYRETIGKYLSGIIVFIGFLMIAADDEKRGLHDRLCDTRVIYNHKTPVMSHNTVPIVQPPTFSAQQSLQAAHLPVDRYIMTLTVKAEHLDEYLQSFYIPQSAVLDELKKAGLEPQNVLRSGNRFIYLFECANIEAADQYLTNSRIYAEWKEKLMELSEENIIFSKAETI